MIASDGLWEFVSNQEVANVVAAGGSLNAICRMLVVKARTQWRKFEETHIDDTTVVLIKLQVRRIKSDGDILEAIQAQCTTMQAAMDSRKPSYKPTDLRYPLVEVMQHLDLRIRRV